MTRTGNTTELQRAQWEASQKRQAARSVFEHRYVGLVCLAAVVACLVMAVWEAVR
jgi:hypothetical protein